jgi:hypothetical protein
MKVMDNRVSKPEELYSLSREGKSRKASMYRGGAKGPLRGGA